MPLCQNRSNGASDDYGERGMNHEAIDLTTLLFTVPTAWVLVMAFVRLVRKETKR